MHKLLTRAYTIACTLGFLAAAIIMALLLSQGCSPHVYSFFPEETLMLIKVIGRSANLLCLITAALCARYALKQFFLEPRRAVGPFLKAMTIFALAFAVPLIFGALAQSALGANPFS